jgi:hypothetical protein
MLRRLPLLLLAIHHRRLEPVHENPQIPQYSSAVLSVVASHPALLVKPRNHEVEIVAPRPGVLGHE